MIFAMQALRVFFRARLGFLSALMLLACVGPAAPLQPREQPQQPARATKTLTIGLTTTLDAFGVGGRITPVGGWGFMDELHSVGLITSDVQSRRPIGRLAARVPSVDDGTVTVLADGRMRVAFTLRPGVTWHDGVPFTAHDLAFSHRIQADPGVPLWRLEPVKEMESVEAADDLLLVITYRQPYYRGANLGLLGFWPLPRHLLGPAYDRYLTSGSPDEVVSLAYWNTEYVHLGPFRVTHFDPGEGVAFEAHEGYFLGRPRLDAIRARIFRDQDTLFSNLLAGAVDVVPDLALTAERGAHLRERWESSGQGTVHITEGAPYMLTPQFRPHLQREPANLDPAVRSALYHALDRETLSEVLNGGVRDLAAWSILARGDELYGATRDTLRRYAYDPERARAILRQGGWALGSDAVQQHESDGRRYRTSITATPGREREIAVFAAYWRQIGIEVEETPMTPVTVRDREARSQFPGWEATGAATGHGMLDVISLPAAGPANRWVGNRPGYEDARAQRLIDALRGSPTEREQAEAMRAISEFVASELPLMMLYHLADYLGVRQGAKALDDLAGSQGGNPLYGGYARNAHFWDVL